LAPHCTAGFVGIAASRHLVSAIPLFLIHEFYPDNADFNKCGIARMEYALDKDGYIGLPPGPGLGVDQRRLEEEAKKPQTYNWPSAKLKDRTRRRARSTRSCPNGRSSSSSGQATSSPRMRTYRLAASWSSERSLSYPHEAQLIEIDTLLITGTLP
jgi:hypothetical protein